MKTGTKSLLFGVHQFVWHPITVYLAWRKLYGRPSKDELLAIVVHDWGYWGCADMDGKEGEWHPIRSSSIAYRLGLPVRTWIETLLHSRGTAEKFEEAPSKLCYADKLSIAYEPRWFYLLRAKLSGELDEYRQRAHATGFCSSWYSNAYWFECVKQHYLVFSRSMASEPGCEPEGAI